MTSDYPDERIKVSGKCDAHCGNDAKYWYGNTASAYCGASECAAVMDSRWEEHCAEMERQFEFEKEMESY